MASPTLGREIEKSGVRKFRLQFRKAVIVKNFQKVPIIQPRALSVSIRDLKSQRTHKVQSATRRRTRAGNISRILRDFGLHQNDVEHNRLPLIESIYRKIAGI